ncbi:uncharacterized protein LOC117782831 [Drosophila innubila]|uniref:uncharacterized protein LOC117782831 n=1 Tax=Drosophila innubila TaxID=198719 RepID=UPI00148C399F|nr:uncharacterized protein LOC117782831 [Drosophila innubila]XP_034475785.1 uncharacterized protein LOC117782831 [Drosophila innubila]XP_034475793.1 uncharacterized protein LOC117782831 [Drosophila innubila]
MRAGKKTETEKGKTRPCIVYVKNLKESETTELLNFGKQSKIVRNVAVKVPNRRINTERERERERKREREQEVRETRTTRRAASIANVELLSKRQTVTGAAAVVVGKSPTAAAAARGRNIKANVLRSTVTAKQATSQQQQARPLSTRRNTELPVARATTTTCIPATLTKRRDTTRLIETESKTQKMYKQSKLMTASPPPTIAASRSRRSIKPNPKYASEDMVTPKYVSSLANESLNKRAGKQLFMDDDDDDEDEDLHDLIEEDNDDELNDAAFIPQMHKSDDDDDMSENEYEQEQEQLRREKVPPKRGRGRPPKNPQAIAAAAAAQATRSASTQYQTGRGGISQSGRGGVTNLQQLRRTMAVNANLARSNMTGGSVPLGNKRKLEDHHEAPIARKRMATDGSGIGSGAGRAPPVINGSTSVAKTTAIGLAKTKVIMGNSNNNSGGGGVRLIQAPNANKPRQLSNFKMSTPVTTTARVGNVARQVATKLQKTTGGGGAGAGGGAASAKMKAISDDVPTFTIVNIDDIINQDDVLITRSSNNNNNNKKLSPAARNTNNNSSSNSNINSRNNQSSSSASTLNNSTSSNNLSLSSSIKRLKSTPTITTTVSTMKVSSSSSTGKQLLETKPRPRILNAEMGKKAPMMKPLMSMGKELCPMTDGIDTEDEDMSNDLDDDITISPPAAAVSAAAPTPPITQARVVRRVQTAKWLPNTRRNILSTTASVNVSNNQRQQLQQQQQKQQQQQQKQQLGSDRKLTKLLGESNDDEVFKKPASPSTSTTTQPQRRSKENAADEDDAATVGGAPSSTNTNTTDTTETDGKMSAKYFPPETTTYCEEDGRIVKKITCYETWHVISTPKESTNKTRQQRTCLELPLVKLANVASRIKVPSSKWTSKVTLYKVSPSLMQRQTMTIFTGDLKTYNIPEEERHKYQPSCVLFRRSVLDRSQCRVPFDRAIIFKNKCFYANIEGKHVNLLGAPEVVNTVKDVEVLIDIVDSLALSSDLVEMVTSK